jgi:uncharacterized membrane protein (DUF2068 family)
MQSDFAHRTIQVLRSLVIADVIMTIASTAVEVLVDPQTLPDDLKKYAVDFADADRFVTAFLGVWAAVLLVADIGLWMLKNWARFLYTFMIILALAIKLFGLEPEVQSAYSAVLSDVASMVEGAILVLIWALMHDQFRSRVATA